MYLVDIHLESLEYVQQYITTWCETWQHGVSFLTKNEPAGVCYVLRFTAT